jgi:hypothetical protein
MNLLAVNKQKLDTRQFKFRARVVDHGFIPLSSGVVLITTLQTGR